MRLKKYLVALTGRQMKIIEELCQQEFNALDRYNGEHSSEQLQLNTIQNSMLKLPKTPKVVIEVLGGVAECTKCPEGIDVVINDHDNANG